MQYRLPLDPPGLGEKLLAKASELTFHLLRFTDKAGDRNIMADYTLQGTLRPDGEGPGDERFIKALIREFLIGEPPKTLDFGDDEDGGAE
ncbi:MAG: hypothetical protein IAF94_03385 [Pirellulaceae bacterium]|nr:hypothetical protein [Pirellulaceae bacterium]